MSGDLMIDLETLGTGYRPCVATVGYCHFDPQKGTVQMPSTLYLDLKDDLQGAIDMDTVLWWLQQDELVRRAVFLTRPRQSVTAAFDTLQPIIENADRVWAKGTDFDLRIINEFYRALVDDYMDEDVKPVIPYYKYRDCRCMYDLLRALGKLPERVTPRHDAGQDAFYQAQVVVAAWNVARGK